MTNYCNNCSELDSENQICNKFKITLPCNIDLEVHKCDQCKEGEEDASKDSIRHNK